MTILYMPLADAIEQEMGRNRTEYLYFRPEGCKSSFKFIKSKNRYIRLWDGATVNGFFENNMIRMVEVLTGAAAIKLAIAYAQAKEAEGGRYSSQGSQIPDPDDVKVANPYANY